MRSFKGWTFIIYILLILIAENILDLNIDVNFYVFFFLLFGVFEIIYFASSQDNILNVDEKINFLEKEFSYIYNSVLEYDITDSFSRPRRTKWRIEKKMVLLLLRC